MKKGHIIALISFAILLIAGAALAVSWPQLFPPPKPEKNVESDSTTDTTVAATKDTTPEAVCPLDGEATTEDKSHRRPIGVMIENSPEARPQSGISKACMVYETVAEGGITRFLVVFGHNDVKDVGPVRSAREAYVYLVKQLNAIYAHCGVGPDALSGTIRNFGISDLDQFANSAPYWRIKTRHAPHNLYASTDSLRKGADARGYKTDTGFQGYEFKKDEATDARPASGSIDINFSKPPFAVHYAYDRETNRYKRSVGGQPHVDAAYNDEQLAPKNVVVQYAPISVADAKGHMRVGLIGSGKAIIFQDGKAIAATWKRQSNADLTRYYDESGNEVTFNPGQIWFELVDPNQMKVTYQAGNNPGAGSNTP